MNVVLNKPPPHRKNQAVLGLVMWQVLSCTVTLFRCILQGIIHLRMCEKCWQSVVEPHLAGKLFHQGVEA